jgi:Secretion system C-terminal sorting domain
MKKIYNTKFLKTLFVFALTTLILTDVKSQILTQGFEGGTFPPTGWLLNPASGNTWETATTGAFGGDDENFDPFTVDPHTGIGMTKFRSYDFNPGASGTISAELISSVIDLSSTGPARVKFWFHQDPVYTNPDSVVIFINTTASLTGATRLGKVIRKITSPRQWNEFIFNFPNSFNTNTNHVIFQAYSRYGNNMFLDDVVVESQPSCQPPTALTVISGFTSSNNSWSAPGGSVTGYEWAVTSSATPPASGTFTTSTSSVSTGLTGTTNYFLHVRTNCGSGIFSTWASSPFFSSFDCSLVTPISACGVSQNAVIAAGAGVYNITACGFNTPGLEKLYSFTPTITGQYTLKITAATGTVYADYFYKNASLGCGTADWICIKDFNAVGSKVFGALTAGVTYYLLLDLESATGGLNQTFQIDCPEIPPVCLMASDYLTPVNNTTVAFEPNTLISWNNVPTATSYDIYVTAGSPPTVATTLLGNLPASVGATSGAFLNTLLPATQYVWYVVGKNTGGGLTTCGLPRTFTTAAASPIPANDECSGAISLTVNADDLCGITTAGTTLGATASSETAPSCNATGTNDDVWYTFMATSTSHIIKITGVTAGAVMSTQVYTGSCGSLALVAGGCSSSYPYTITGLTSGTMYTVRVNTVSTLTNNKSNFVICVGSIPGPPSNDDAPGAIALTVGGGCTTAPYSNISATQSPAEPFPSCKGTAGFAGMWYKFVAPASGSVRLSCDEAIGSFGDSRMALYSTTNVNDYTTFSIIACDDDNGTVVAARSLFYTSGLTPGSTYYIQVDLYSSTTTKGTYCVKVDELSGSMLASTTGDCVGDQGSINSYSATYTGWVSLVDVAGNLNANVRQTAGTATSFSSSRTITAGSPRIDGLSQPYLNRNFLINGTGATSADVQMYFNNAELTSLGGGLAGYKVNRVAGATCNANFTGTSTLLSQTANGSGNGANYIQFTTSGFSNFYIVNGAIILPSADVLSGRKQGSTNLLDWKVSCTSSSSVDITLERSADNRNFAPLQTQNATAARCDQNFTYVDASPVAGINYYRVKLVTPQGSVRYTSIVALLSATKGFELISLAPNPVKDMATLSISSAKAGKIDMSVLDFSGKMLSKESITVIAGNNPIAINFASLAAGTYTIVARNAEGELKTTRFVKY